MRAYLFGLAISLALAAGMPARAGEEDNQGGGVPKLDHVFVIVLENHNSFTSFGSNGIIGNPQAPNITALWNKYNVTRDAHGRARFLVAGLIEAKHPDIYQYRPQFVGISGGPAYLRR
jgi:hypothetical protein